MGKSIQEIKKNVLRESFLPVMLIIVLSARCSGKIENQNSGISNPVFLQETTKCIIPMQKLPHKWYIWFCPTHFSPINTISYFINRDFHSPENSQTFRCRSALAGKIWSIYI